MIKNKTIFKPALGWMSTLAIIVASPLIYAQDLVTVKALAVHSAGNIQYSYEVSNRTSARKIYTVSIGNGGDNSDDPKTQANEQPELAVYPTGSYWEKQPDEGDSRDVSLRVGGTFNSPQGWAVDIEEYEQTKWPGIERKFSIGWNIDEKIISNYPDIYPSQTFNFGVTVPQRDPPYLNGHFTVRFDDNEKPGTYTGTIVPMDTTPPTLTINLSPATLWPPNKKAAPITVYITVKDDYDTEPEIKLQPGAVGRAARAGGGTAQADHVGAGVDKL